jgi:hypothetical protein
MDHAIDHPALLTIENNADLAEAGDRFLELVSDRT